jgi:hypothetical protein
LFVPSLQERLNLGFLTEGKLAAILITPSSWGSQRAGRSPRTKTISCFSSTVAGEKIGRLLRREFLHAHPLLCYCFALLYLFYLHRFISKTKKKLESLVVVIFLLLVHYVVP